MRRKASAGVRGRVRVKIAEATSGDGGAKPIKL